MDFFAKWICPKEDFGEICPIYRKNFEINHRIKEAVLHITSIGVYEAFLNGNRVGDFYLAPGWTEYGKRIQYQSYDVSEILKEENELSVTVGKGWCRSKLFATPGSDNEKIKNAPPALLAQLEITFVSGEKYTVISDGTWTAQKSRIVFSDIYDGEVFDAVYCTGDTVPVKETDVPAGKLIKNESVTVCAHERIMPARRFATPKNESVIDFGQNLTGIIELTVKSEQEQKITVSFAEVLDKNGNFYNENYRSAKSEFTVFCEKGEHTYCPHFTFFGFRFAKIECEYGADILAEAIAIYSDIRQTGNIISSNPKLNKLYKNILWGQKDNFLDVPTDCPQRDERLGWTGDAQVFILAACYNFNVKQFFEKWLNDVAVCQQPNGAIPRLVPDRFCDPMPSAGWGDAATICPWVLYEFYGDKNLLEKHFPMMKKWVDYIRNVSGADGLWQGGSVFGDWLGLDAPAGSYMGSTRPDFISAAFFIYSTDLLIRAGEVLGEDVSEYKELYKKTANNFKKTFPEYTTQTEYALAIHFGLAENPSAASERLAELVKKCGHLQTGFIGTPYLLHALSRYGYADVAWKLLLRSKYPSWLYSVEKGATTVWEHWDGIRENGEFWDKNMNSFNHYAYGAVADWMYSVAGGIKPLLPGFKEVLVAPHPTKSLDSFSVSLETSYGTVSSSWEKQGEFWRYEISVPVFAKIIIGDTEYVRPTGEYIFFDSLEK